MPNPRREDAPIYFQVHKIKKLYCMAAAILLAIGILGSQALGCTVNLAGCVLDTGREAVLISGGLPEKDNTESIAPKPAMEKVPDGFAPLAGEGIAGGAQQKYGVARAVQDVDDFRLVSHMGGSGPITCSGLRFAFVLPFVKESGAPFCPGFWRRRLWQRLNQIPLFHIVVFIHRTDGKKKSCFA